MFVVLFSLEERDLQRCQIHTKGTYSNMWPTERCFEIPTPDIAGASAFMSVIRDYILAMQTPKSAILNELFNMIKAISAITLTPCILIICLTEETDLDKSSYKRCHFDFLGGPRAIESDKNFSACD